MRATLEQLLNGEVDSTSIINEPVVDLAVEEPKGESAEARALRRWLGRPRSGVTGAS